MLLLLGAWPAGTKYFFFHLKLFNPFFSILSGMLFMSSGSYLTLASFLCHKGLSWPWKGSGGGKVTYDPFVSTSQVAWAYLGVSIVETSILFLSGITFYPGCRHIMQ
jgi:hypothetical protein